MCLYREKDALNSLREWERTLLESSTKVDDDLILSQRHELRAQTSHTSCGRNRHWLARSLPQERQNRVCLIYRSIQRELLRILPSLGRRRTGTRICMNSPGTG